MTALPVCGPGWTRGHRVSQSQEAILSSPHFHLCRALAIGTSHWTQQSGSPQELLYKFCHLMPCLCHIGKARVPEPRQTQLAAAAGTRACPACRVSLMNRPRLPGSRSPTVTTSSFSPTACPAECPALGERRADAAWGSEGPWVGARTRTGEEAEGHLRVRSEVALCWRFAQVDTNGLGWRRPWVRAGPWGSGEHPPL